MKKAISILLSFVMLLSMSACSSGVVDDESAARLSERLKDNRNLSIISYNVAGPWGNLLKGTHYSTRINHFYNQMRAYYPDSFGTQETDEYWVRNIEQEMPEYASYWVIRGGDDSIKKSEMNAIFYLKDKYNLIDSDTFWLSLTPEEQTKYEGAGCYRICSWVLLENKTTGYRYIHMNTHLDNASEEAACFGAGVILEKYNEIMEEYPSTPVVLTGDFNQTIGSETYNILNDSAFDDVRFLCDNTNSESTYNGWDKDYTGTEPIDHIFIIPENFKANSFSMLEKTTDGKLVSDHFAIKAELEIIQ